MSSAKKTKKEQEKASRPLVGKCQLPGCEAISVGAGRPTVYRPEHCETVVELGRKGYSKAMMAAELDVVRQTLDEWAARYPDFSNAMLRARDFSLAWWEAQGMQGIWGGKDFNANAYRLQVTNRFPQEWKDKQEVENKHSGTVEGPVLNLVLNGVKSGS